MEQYYNDLFKSVVQDPKLLKPISNKCTNHDFALDVEGTGFKITLTCDENDRNYITINKNFRVTIWCKEDSGLYKNGHNHELPLDFVKIIEDKYRYDLLFFSIIFLII